LPKIPAEKRASHDDQPLGQHGRSPAAALRALLVAGYLGSLGDQVAPCRRRRRNFGGAAQPGR